jgi:hypothetical protein
MIVLIKDIIMVRNKMLLLTMIISLTANACSKSLEKPHTSKKPHTSEKKSILSNQQLKSPLLYGKWRVVSYKFGDAPSAFSEEDAKKYINQNVLFSPNLAVVFKDTCHIPTYDLKIESKEDYLYNFFNQTSSLGFKENSLYVYDLVCKGKPIYVNDDEPEFNWTIIQVNEKTIIIPFNGVFFYLEKESERVFSKNFDGTGDFEEILKFTKNRAVVTINYEFYKASDQIIITNSQGDELFSTKMKSTNQINTSSFEINLSEKESKIIHLKIKSSDQKKSMWKINIKITEF